MDGCLQYIGRQGSEYSHKETDEQQEMSLFDVRITP